MVSQCKIVCEGLHFYNMGCVSSKLGIKSPFTLLIFLFFCPRELPVTDTTSETSSCPGSMALSISESEIS